jgi:hypothetical protein
VRVTHERRLARATSFETIVTEEDDDCQYFDDVK